MLSGELQKTRRRSATERRKEILRTAERLFARHGYEATRTHHISREMDISEGLIFRYFPSKEAILAEIVKRGTSRLDKDLAPVLEASDGAGMDAVLLAVLQRYLEAIERNREFVALFFGEEAHNPELRHSVEPVLDKLNQQLASYLAERQRLGFLRTDIDPEAAARAFWTLLFGGARDVILSPESVPQVQHTLSTALTIFLSGLKR